VYLLAVTHPCKNQAGVAILVSLQECGVFQNITLHRATNSGKPQSKFRLGFFERNKLRHHVQYTRVHSDERGEIASEIPKIIVSY